MCISSGHQLVRIDVRAEAAGLTQPTPTVVQHHGLYHQMELYDSSILVERGRSPVGVVITSTMLQPPTYRVLDISDQLSAEMPAQRFCI